MSQTSSLEQIAKDVNAIRFRIRDVHTLRDYLTLHRMNKMWISAICLETGFHTQFMVTETRFFCLSHPNEIEYLKTISADMIRNLVALNKHSVWKK